MKTCRGLPVHAAAALVLLGGLLALKGFNPYDEGVWGEMATHVMMARSLAYDGDLAYEEGDVQRWLDSPPSGQGPRGLFLKRTDAGRYHYASPFLYALCAAPAVRAVGDRGLLALNVVCLALLVWILARWWGRTSAPWHAAVFALAVLGFSVAPAYLFVMEPDLFRATLLAGGVALLLGGLPQSRLVRSAHPQMRTEGSPHLRMRTPYSDCTGSGGGKGRVRGVALEVARASSPCSTAKMAVPLQGVGRSWRLAAGAVLLGLAAYEKPLLAIFVLCVAVHVVVARGWKASALVAVLAVAGWLAPTAVHLAQDGTVTPYRGDRRQYAHGAYPLTEFREAFVATSSEERVLEDGGISRRLSVLPPAGLAKTLGIARADLPLNLWYFLAGRQTGLVAYAPGLLVCVVVFLASKGRRRGASILAAGALYALFYFLWSPLNYAGGGTSLGNRHLLHVLPALCLSASALPRRRLFAVAVAPVVLVGALFLNPVLLSPRFALLGHLNRIKRPGLVWLPIELTQVRAMLTSPREVMPLAEGERLYTLAGTRPSAMLGWVVARDHTVRLVLEAPWQRQSVRLRVLAGPSGVELRPLERSPRKGWSSGLFPGACRAFEFPLPPQTRFLAEDGERYAAEFGFKALVAPEAAARTAATLRPDSPPAEYAPPSGAIRLGEAGDDRYLVWGWTEGRRDDAGAAYRSAEDQQAFILVYLAPARAYALALEGRSDVLDQHVAVSMNNRPVGEFALGREWATVRCAVPVDVLVDEVTTIRLDHARPAPRPQSAAATAPGQREPVPRAEYRSVSLTAVE